MDISLPFWGSLGCHLAYLLGKQCCHHAYNCQIFSYYNVVLQSKRAKLLILCYLLSNSLCIELESQLNTYLCRVCTCDASGSGRGSVVTPIRRCGQFSAAGKQKTLGIGLDELAPVKNTDWPIVGTACIIVHPDRECLILHGYGETAANVQESRKSSCKTLGIENTTSTFH